MTTGESGFRHPHYWAIANVPDAAVVVSANSVTTDEFTLGGIAKELFHGTA